MFNLHKILEKGDRKKIEEVVSSGGELIVRQAFKDTIEEILDGGGIEAESAEEIWALQVFLRNYADLWDKVNNF
jgi:copper homeostasis protein CutC